MDTPEARTGMKKAAYIAGMVIAAALATALAATIILLPFMIHSHIQ